MLAKDIVCVACSSYFEFSVEEQDFYETKGFQPPKKCKACRAQAKQRRDSYQTGGEYGSKPFSQARPMFDACCHSCNNNMQLPFQPDGSRPVYCPDCYKNNSSVKQAHG